VLCSEGAIQIVDGGVCSHHHHSPHEKEEEGEETKKEKKRRTRRRRKMKRIQHDDDDEEEEDEEEEEQEQEEECGCPHHRFPDSPYVSPECVVAKEGEVVDVHTADIWSLGVVLYTMLTARRLYTSPGDKNNKIISLGGYWRGR